MAEIETNAPAVKKQNFCIDFIKGIACICVVFMHCEFPGNLGILVQCVSRFCVPFFFMVSGYFAFYGEAYKSREERTNKARKKIRHIGFITLCASVFYLVFAAVQALMGLGEISVSLRDAVQFLLLNQMVVIVSQMWFLYALLYVYILWAAVDRFDLYKLAYILIPILFAAYICLAQGAHLAHIYVPNMFYRNFLVEGFPLFMLGHLIHRYQDRIKIGNRALLATVALTTVLCVAERYYMGRDFGVNIVTFPQVTALFLLGVKNPQAFENRILRKLGTRYSMLVYILHPFVWHVLEYAYSWLGIWSSTAALYAMPVLVLALTVLLACACRRGKAVIAGKKR